MIQHQILFSKWMMIKKGGDVERGRPDISYEVRLLYWASEHRRDKHYKSIAGKVSSLHPRGIQDGLAGLFGNTYFFRFKNFIQPLDSQAPVGIDSFLSKCIVLGVL